MYFLQYLANKRSLCISYIFCSTGRYLDISISVAGMLKSEAILDDEWGRPCLMLFCCFVPTATLCDVVDEIKGRFPRKHWFGIDRKGRSYLLFFQWLRVAILINQQKKTHKLWTYKCLHTILKSIINISPGLWSDNILLELFCETIPSYTRYSQPLHIPWFPRWQRSSGQHKNNSHSYIPAPWHKHIHILSPTLSYQANMMLV